MVLEIAPTTGHPTTLQNSGPLTSQLSYPQQDLPRPAIPDQADFYARTVSFKVWPKGAGVKVSDLVNSGFSYLGAADRVQCFQCGEIFENWRKGESVDIEHTRLSPNCVFIRRKLGKNVERPPPIYSNSEYNVTTNGPTLMPVMEPFEVRVPIFPHMDYRHVVDVPASGPKQARNVHPVAPRDIRARLDFDSTRKLLDIGFMKPLLAQVIGERLAETGDDFPSFMDYFIAVKNAEQILSGGQVDTLKAYYDKSIERLSNPASLVPEEEEPVESPNALMDEASSKGSPAPNNKNSANSDSLLRRKKECNVCMDAETDSVFMPCRHMCACSTCAEKLANCPICRKEIEHCIKVYA